MTLSMTKDERIAQLEESLRPFSNAFARCRYYKSPNSNDIPLMAEGISASWELFADENEAHGKDPKTLLAVGHLANANQVIEAEVELTDGEDT